MVLALGLLGLLTVELLRANGCQVLAVDMHPQRLALAARLGPRPSTSRRVPIRSPRPWRGRRVRGSTAMLITATAKSDDLIHQAAEACRKRGRIVLVGVIGLNLRRSDFYQKEITFQVSCSYGPGRYDEKYEQGGQDYPLPFVRWTEQRNFEAVLVRWRRGS